MRYLVKYIAGGQNLHTPGNKNLLFVKEGVKVEVPVLFSKEKDVLIWENIQRADIKEDVEKNLVSIGKAIAGGVLFGGVGALIGAATGSKKVVTSLFISYLTASNENKLLILTMSPQYAHKIKLKIDEELINRFGTAERIKLKEEKEVPASSDAERIQALSKLAEMHEQGILNDAEFEEQKTRLLN